jgi:hypothetical protein
VTVHQLVTRPAAISTEVVTILEDYLQMAKQGEITAIAIAAVELSGAAVHQASSSDHQMQLLGAVTRLLHRMHINADEATDEF